MGSIAVHNLTYRYPDAEEPALVDVDVSLPAGRWLLVQGPTGSGKSTLLRCLTGACPQFYGGTMRGRISIAGKDVAKLEPLERVRRIGFVGQNPDAEAVYHRVDREVAFALENVGVPPEDMSWRVAEVLEMVGMSDYVHAEIRQLSGGQRQRVALAAALVHQPEVLVLDEPTAQLDPVAAAEWFQLLRRLNQEFGLTIVMSEHRIDPAYAEVDHVWYLERGRLRFAGDATAAAAWLREHRPASAPTLARLLLDDARPLLTVRAVRDALRHRLQEGAEPSTGTSREVCPVAPSVQTMVSLRQATVTYPGASLPALDECSFSVPRGQLTVLMGPNGSGKSTALRVLAGLQPLVRGHIRGGAKIRRRRDTPGEPGELRVGYVPQNPVLYFSQRTVRDEVALAATLRGLSADATSAAVDEVLRRLSLTELVDRHPRELSGGEQLRVAVAAVMVRHPDLLLLDEPTRGLDVTAKAELGNWLKQDGRTVVMATHDLDFAAEFADHAVFFHAGHAVLEGPPVQIFRRALTFAPTISRAFRPFHLDVHCLADAMKVGMAR